MGPSEGRDVSQKVGLTVETGAAAACDGLAEMLGVPVDDSGGEQVEACHAEVLTFGGSVADFALAADAEDVFQSVMGLAFVQPDLGAALHVGIEQPLHDEERPLDPSDFPEGNGQLVLSGVGCEFTQQLAWRHDARDHGGGAAQDAGPVCRDERFLDLAADQPLQLFGAGRRFEEIEALRCRLPRPATLSPIRPRSRGFSRRGGLSGPTGHVSLCAKQPRKQARHGQVDIDSIPVQAIACAQDFNRSQLVICRGFQALRHAGRQGECAAIRQIDNDAAAVAIIASQCRTRLGETHGMAPLKSRIDVRNSQLSHGFPSIWQGTLPAGHERFAQLCADRWPSYPQPRRGPAPRQNQSD